MLGPDIDIWRRFTPIPAFKLVLQALTDKSKIRCIPNNFQSFKCLEIGQLKILDSMEFLNASLDALTADLAVDGSQQFYHLRSHFKSEEKVELLYKKKGFYPYTFPQDYSYFAGNSSQRGFLQWFNKYATFRWGL